MVNRKDSFKNALKENILYEGVFWLVTLLFRGIGRLFSFLIH